MRKPPGDGNDETHFDWASIKRVVRVKNASAVPIERTLDRCRQKSVPDICIIESPKVRLRTVKAKRCALDPPGGASDREFDEVEAPAKDRPDRARSLILRPIGFLARERIAKDPDVRRPDPEFPVKIVLAVPQGLNSRPFGRGRLGGGSADGQQSRCADGQ